MGLRALCGPFQDGFVERLVAILPAIILVNMTGRLIFCRIVVASDKDVFFN